MTTEEMLKEKEDEMQELLQKEVDKLNEEIQEVKEELDELTSKRNGYQRRINAILGVTNSPAYKYQTPLRMDILSVLKEADGEMSSQEICAAVKENGRDATNNHLSTVLSGMKKNGEVINTGVGKYMIPTEEKDDE
ncbi:MAG: hypothetical protein KAS32_19550 [Candidatus Peribacteraceae bacterium]|nr:hypothetical protein [Candidatus Peribacteraceae bacterium]